MDANYPDFSWEGIEVTTDDGYMLTLFHIWSDSVTEVKSPVLFQHGSGGTAAGWLGNYGPPAPFFTFVDMGHHVYIGNNRGNEYSQGHTTADLITSNPEQYWDFSWAEMSQDVYANCEAMFNSAG